MWNFILKFVVLRKYIHYMKIIISWLSRYSLLVNYFFFFAVSLLLNLVFVYLPFGLYVSLEQLVKFFLFLSVVVYVTNNPKVIKISFWTMLGVGVANVVFSVLKHHISALSDVWFGLGTSFVISLVTLYILLLLWSNCLPNMRGIIGSMCAITIYSGFLSLPLSDAASSLLGSAEAGSNLAFGFLPFVLMMFLFFFIVRDGRKRKGE